MPWCEGCSRFLNPNTLREDGTCPECDSQVAEVTKVTKVTEVADVADVADGTDTMAAATVPQRTPWHFKVLVALTVIYLTWRVIQMITWVIT